ncbi:MAG: helix-turn-helix transcriptional regulator [Syntrophobacterales bacterium]|nr:MAG: helix-turn-helix transcriptional regulator [Syntrophobacterales bacterium]
MRDEEKDMSQLVSEITALRRRVAELEEASHLEDVQTTRELESNEDKYRIILENMEEAYFELDLTGNITFFNSATLEMLGYSAEELAHMNYRDYVLPETTIRLFKVFNKVYRTGEPADIFDYQVIRKDGTGRFREMSTSLIQDPAGSPIGFRCLARDVTTRKLAEETLNKKEKELEKKSASLVESNAALKVLLKQREEDKVEFERNVVSNVREIVVPYIEELKKSQLTVNQSVCIETVDANLKNIISPFLRNITLKQFNLTPKEFQVANLVKEGRTTKEIADFLNISPGAIDFHRNSIRKKLGLNNKKSNLRSYLLSLS